MPRGSSNSGRHNGASQQVLTYLRENPNVTIPYAEIKGAIRAAHDYTVANAVGSLVEKGIPIERPQRGLCIYRPVPIAPEKAPSDNMQRLFEYVGESGDYIIVRDEVMKMYVLKPLSDLFKGE